MRVDGPHQIFHGSLKLHGGNGFGDQFGRLWPDDVDPENFAVVSVGNNFYETFVLTYDRCTRVRSEGKLADLHVITGFAGPGFGEAYAADFRMAVSGAWNVFGIDGLAGLARNLRDRDQRFHGADVGELRRTQDNVANRINTGLGGMHPGIDLDEPSFRLDFRLLQANVFGAGLAADSDQDFLRFNLLLLAVDADRHSNTRFCLIDLLNFGAGVEVDTALAVDARQFFGDFLVFNRNESWQHLHDSHFATKGAIDGSEFHSHRSSTDYHQRLRHLFQAE